MQGTIYLAMSEILLRTTACNTTPVPLRSTGEVEAQSFAGKEEREVKIERIQGPSRFWRCPSCGATLQKKENLMVEYPDADVGGSVTCGGCRESFDYLDVYTGKYDLPEIRFACPHCSKTLRGPADELLGKPCPACDKPIPKTSVPGSGCFIATAACGHNTWEVKTRCSFRDDVLSRSYFGRILTDLYYRTSPPIARFVGAAHGLRSIVRGIVVRPLAQLAAWLMRR